MNAFVGFDDGGVSSADATPLRDGMSKSDKSRTETP
jgi:hypothetical protein